MPTIEIASINSTGLNLNQHDFAVAIIEQNKLHSHRGMFSDLLKKEEGVLVHIGNPEFKEDKDGAFFAGQIINWDFKPTNKIVAVVNSTDAEYDLLISQQFQFQFDEEYKKDISKLMELALSSSSLNKIYFLTDYQFGPVGATKESGNNIADFWDKHDNNGLIFNRLYEINFPLDM